MVAAAVPVGRKGELVRKARKVVGASIRLGEERRADVCVCLGCVWEPRERGGAEKEVRGHIGFLGGALSFQPASTLLGPPR